MKLGELNVIVSNIWTKMYSHVSRVPTDVYRLYPLGCNIEKDAVSVFRQHLQIKILNIYPGSLIS